MSAMGWLRFNWLAYAAKPAHDRAVFRAIKATGASSVLEIGIGSLDRAKDIIAACRRSSQADAIRYAAVDWFEERPAGMPPISLIAAHRDLGATGAKVRVSPGGPAAVEAVANALPNLDLVLIAPEVQDEQLGRGWGFLPRMCHPETVILRGVAQGEDACRYERLPLGQVAALADQQPARLAA